MSLLSYNQLRLLQDDGVIVYSEPHLVNSSSIDIQLGSKLLIERTDPKLYQSGDLRRVVLKERDQLHMIEWNLDREGEYVLYPGEFILAHSKEIFNLPNNISASYKLKSSMARIGLEHLNAGWCDAGWNGSVLTLELKNMTRHHEIVLQRGDLIGQVAFFLHEEVPSDRSYAKRGRYNNDKSVSGAKSKSRTIIYGEKNEDREAEEYAANNPVEELILPPPRKIIQIGDEE